MPYIRKSVFHSKVASDDFVRAISRLNFNEARRLKDPIYKVLYMELCEEGCRFAAKYFRCLVRKEADLNSTHSIRYLVKEEPALLIAMTDNAKLAEKAAKLSSGDGGGMQTCFKCLYQTLKLLHKFEYEYDWLLNDLYKIFIWIVERHKEEDDKCGQCMEIKARLFCIYGTYLGKRVENLQLCFNYFMKSLEICRGETWSGTDLSDSYADYTLHEIVVSKLGKTLIAYARAFADKEPRLGIEMAQRAIEAIAEVKNVESKLLLCEAFLIKIRFLVDARQHHEAMFNIDMVESRLTTELGADYARLSGELFLLKGEFYKLYGKPTKALLKFKQSLLVSRKYCLRSNEGLTLIQLGKLYMDYPEGKTKAREALEEANAIFIELLDNMNRMLVNYLLAKLNVMERFPRVMRIIKKSDNFCDLHVLRQWKYLCKPFWSLEKRSTGFTLPTNILSQLTVTRSLEYDAEVEAAQQEVQFDLDEAESIFAHVPYTVDELQRDAQRLVRVSIKPHIIAECLMND